MGLKIKPPPLRSENLARFRGFLFFSDFDFRKIAVGFYFFRFRFPKNANLGFYFFQKSPESRFLSVFPFDNAHFTPKIFRRAFGAHFSSISPWYIAGNFSSTKTIIFYWFSLVNLTVSQKIFALRAKNDRGFLFFSDFDLGKNTRGFLFFSKISEINRSGFLFKGGFYFQSHGTKEIPFLGRSFITTIVEQL